MVALLAGSGLRLVFLERVDGGDVAGECLAEEGGFVGEFSGDDQVLRFGAETAVRPELVLQDLVESFVLPGGEAVRTLGWGLSARVFSPEVFLAHPNK